MNTITTYISKSGSTIYNHLIHTDIPCPKSYASLVLLSNDLLLQDKDYLDTLYTKTEMINFSRTFLYNVQQKLGKLRCTYCSRNNLIIEMEGMKVPNHKKATIDHVIPISHGIDPLDQSNLVVACQSCNRKKSNHTLSVFLSRYHHLKPNMKILSKFL